MLGMERYPRAAVERTMKVQEVMLRAMAAEDHLVSGRRDAIAPITVKGKNPPAWVTAWGASR